MRCWCDAATPCLAPGRRVSDHQRRLLHGFDLLDQHVHLTAPIVAAAEPGKVQREDRVLPAARQPGSVVNQAQRAERLDQRQYTLVKTAQLLIAVQQGAKLLRALAPAAR